MMRGLFFVGVDRFLIPAPRQAKSRPPEVRAKERRMKTGTVVYLAGIGEIPAELDVDAELARAGLDPAWTEVSAPAAGFCTVQRAALNLAARGAGRIALASASYDGGGLKVSGERRRLAG